MNAQVWSVNLEHGERWWYAHVIELPGCFTRGQTRGIVLNKLLQAITQHLAFLQRKGQKLSVKTQEFQVVEETNEIPELGEAGGAVALFTSDLAPLSQVEFNQFLHLMEWNREDLVALVQPVTDATRDVRLIPTKWTINETLRHIANAEEWYISRLGPAIQSEYESLLNQTQHYREEKSILAHLAAVRHCAFHVLKKAFSQGVSRTFTRSTYTRHPHERWTLRKVLRRFVEHEGEHIHVIEQLIATQSRSS
ncbi:MAG: DinB family protein [Candidatus Odinarchaeota archaeon]